jgi:hypothetical protein
MDTWSLACGYMVPCTWLHDPELNDILLHCRFYINGASPTDWMVRGLSPCLAHLPS